MSRIKDLTGQVFGRLTVISFSHTDKRREAVWNVICTCGSLKVVVSHNLVSGKTRSCGCYHREKVSEDNKGDGFSSARKAYYDYARGSRSRNYSFTISFEEYYTLSQQLCHYCGCVPNRIFKPGRCIPTHVCNGIDRVDNARGYELDNCVSCCATCNRAKRMMSETEFKEWINRVYHHWANNEI